jgi:hypothetical protein
MGVPIESSFELKRMLSELQLPPLALQELESLALTRRSDLKRIAAEEGAQGQTVSMARVCIR